MVYAVIGIEPTASSALPTSHALSLPCNLFIEETWSFALMFPTIWILMAAFLWSYLIHSSGPVGPVIGG